MFDSAERLQQAHIEETGRVGRALRGPKIHVLNPAPAFQVPSGHRRRPRLLDRAELRARYVQVDRLRHWAALRAVEHMRGNTREERERAFRAFFGAVFHAADIVNGRVWGSQEFLAQQCGLTASRVSRLVDAAKACGYLKTFTVIDNPHAPEKRRTILYVQDRLYLDFGFTEAEIRKERTAAKARRDSAVQAPTNAVQGIKLRKALELDKRRDRSRGPVAGFGGGNARRKAEAAAQQAREQDARRKAEAVQYFLARGYSNQDAIERAKAAVDSARRRQSG